MRAAPPEASVSSRDRMRRIGPTLHRSFTAATTAGNVPHLMRGLCARTISVRAFGIGGLMMKRFVYAVPMLSVALALASANGKAPGFAPPNVLSPELIETAVAQGSTEVENPSALTSFYGYDNDGPMLPALGSNVEATKT